MPKRTEDDPNQLEVPFPYQHVEDRQMPHSAKRIAQKVEREVAHFAPLVKRIQLLHV